MKPIDPQMMHMFEELLALLVVASLAGWMMAQRAKSEAMRATIANLNARTRAWWMMSAIFVLTLMVGRIGSVIMFCFVSFMALREYITLTETRHGDHRALFWAFFIITPLQYWLVGERWYGMFTLMIPVYAFLFIPSRMVLTGDTKDFLGRSARMQWGLMICVYCISHAPALLMLEIPGYKEPNAKLLLYLICVDQMSDVLQFIWGKLLGHYKIAPNISPNKTVEGSVGGVLSATAIGTLLYTITPFSLRASFVMSLCISLMGFFGGLTMSAIKRDRGLKDFGTMIDGHGGFLDRIDSLCFAAPIFFHLTRYFYASPAPDSTLWRFFMR